MQQTSQNWERLFGDKGFDWSFRMRAGDARDFFSPTAEGEKILEHKKATLDQYPSRYLAESEGAQPLVDELIKQAVNWNIIAEEESSNSDLRSLSLQMEPDILLVDAASLSFVAGCVCMPSSWSLSHAMGKPVHEVHASVPKLNERIGQHIDRFLRSIPRGKSFCRENWSITLTDELDYHPDRERPKPDRSTAADALYLRLEHQLFTTIPNGILMGIRIEAVPFAELRQDGAIWHNLAETIRTMPDDVASYKGMLDYRSSLAERMLI